IELDGKPTIDAGYPIENIAENQAAVSYRSSLRAQQDAMTARIEQAIGSTLDVRWNLTLAMNVISANVRYGDIAKIKALSGVKDVFLETRYEPPVTVESDETADPNTANTSDAMVGAAQTWAEGYTGAGHTVAIIDTGVDYLHQSFNEDAFNHAIAETGKTVNLMTASTYSGMTLNGSGRYVSAKIPFGYNYVDQTNTLENLGHMQDTAGEHGSHVAGISAANRFIKSGSSYVDAASSVHAVGMAPDAQILIMKVFGANGGAYDSDYMAAIEDCLTMGVDVCNLSLGSSAPGFTTSDAYQSVLNKLADGTQNTKLVVSISAGNAGAFTENLTTDLYIDDVYMHTGGSPGSFTNSLCVASADNTGVTGAPLVYNGTNMFYNETDSTGAKMATIPGTWSFVYIDAFGEAADYEAVNSAVGLSDKIVIVNRGSISFYEKGNNAIDYSPKAVIVANNAAGTINMSLDDYTGTFPMVSITLAAAETIKDTAASHSSGGYTYYTGSITVSTDLIHEVVSQNAEMSVFSSWGVPGSLIMKPEITAPGGNIYSVFGSNNTSSGTTGGSDQYELMSGTSMAAPHITGLTAVLAQYLAENNLSVEGHTTRQLIQSLLMSTAVPMHIDSGKGPYYPILQQGAGLANVHQAVHALSAIFMGADATASYADGKVKAELGDKPAKSGSYTYSFEIHNMSDTALTYELDTQLFTQDQYKDEGYIYMDPATTDLEPYGWTTTYAWDGASVESHDVNRDGVTNNADADAILAYLAGNTPAAAEGDLVVPAHGSKTVTVTIHVPADTSDMDSDYPSGAYVEGYTFVNCISETNDGEMLDVVHSIPILGFYGSWTDPSMFDNMSYVDGL
ncbi:MAG: S8 family serine peptidase, partial [Oscillospiraceae bacterium]|nr:S8 family serine peptidase [Oscillospiraceae bacterium]